MLDETLLSDVILNIPNFIGFIVGILFLYKAFNGVLEQNKRLIEALISRENCEETEDKPI